MLCSLAWKATRKEVAAALKDWALEGGAVGYAHMFSPMRVADGRTQAAYKCDHDGRTKNS